MSVRDQLAPIFKTLEDALAPGRAAARRGVAGRVSPCGHRVLVLITNALAFRRSSLIAARVALCFSLSRSCVGYVLALPWRALERPAGRPQSRSRFPAIRAAPGDFRRARPGRARSLPRVAGRGHARRWRKSARTGAPGFRPQASGLDCVWRGASLGVLIWMILAGPGFLGHGAALLWAGRCDSAAPFYDIQVSPGDVSVRRNADQMVTAQLIGRQAESARLYARYQSASKWDQVTMQPQPAARASNSFSRGFPKASSITLKPGRCAREISTLRVLDLPEVKKIRVTYRFPSWTRTAKCVEEHGGDLRAVEGTEADLKSRPTSPCATASSCSMTRSRLT